MANSHTIYFLVEPLTTLAEKPHFK